MRNIIIIFDSTNKHVIYHLILFLQNEHREHRENDLCVLIDGSGPYSAMVIANVTKHVAKSITVQMMPRHRGSPDAHHALRLAKHASDKAVDVVFFTGSFYPFEVMKTMFDHGIDPRIMKGTKCTTTVKFPTSTVHHFNRLQYFKNRIQYSSAPTSTFVVGKLRELRELRATDDTEAIASTTGRSCAS